MDLIRKWWWVVLVGVVNFNSLILKRSGIMVGGGTRVSNRRDFLFLIHYFSSFFVLSCPRSLEVVLTAFPLRLNSTSIL